jgi:DNA-binding MurR/RpiR family transcriptional regulator
MLRDGVEVADAGSIALSRTLAWLEADDVLVVVDTARYEASVASAAERAAAAGARVLAVSDSHVSPIARVATWSFPVLDTGAGPFDSFVGALALTNLLAGLAARRLGRRAVRRLDRLEADWDAAGILRRD